MAEHLASIYGTEKDKVNCPFYFKIGACRHGDRCSRLHNKPQFSEAVLLQNMYQNPALMQVGPDGQPLPYDPKEAQRHFEEFYEEVFEESQKFGKIVEMYVCDNICDHLVGNVYIHFDEEDGATQCVQALNGRFYAGRPIVAELSPVTDFKEARCWQYETGECTRGGYCNFMHIKQLSKGSIRRLYGSSHALDRSRAGRRDGRDERDRGGERDYRDSGRDSRDRYDGRGRGDRYRDDRDRGDRYKDERYDRHYSRNEDRAHRRRERDDEDDYRGRRAEGGRDERQTEDNEHDMSRDRSEREHVQEPYTSDLKRPKVADEPVNVVESPRSELPPEEITEPAKPLDASTKQLPMSSGVGSVSAAVPLETSVPSETPAPGTDGAV